MAYNVKFLKGTSAQFETLSKDLNTFYYIDDKDLYLGNTKLSNGEDLAAAIVRIAAIEADYLKTADKTGLQGQIDEINRELGALTGSESGQSISQMINAAIEELDNDLQPQITANANAIKAIQDDYLKAADKTELEGKITAEATTARAAEKANADAIAAVKEDVDAFFADADMTASAKDTLKEIQEYINSDAGAAAEMTASIKANADAIDAIEADYLKAADKTELTNAINGKVAQGDFDTLAGRVTTVEGAVATKAESSVVEGISGKVTALEGKVDVEKVSTAISTAVTNAVAGLDADKTSATVEEGKGIQVQVVEVDGKITNVAVSGNYDNKYDVKGAATTAESNAKNYVDQEIGKLSYDASGSAAQALVDAKKYTDEEIAKLEYDAAGSANAALASAKTYTDNAILALDADITSAAVETGKGIQVQVVETDGKVASVVVSGNYSNLYDAKGAAATAESNAVTTAAGDATSKANTAEANAKAYVDGALTWGTIA